MADLTQTTIVALTPAEMVPAHIAWCDRKIRALEDEADELQLHQELALANGWKTSVVTASQNRTARRITYYQKMRAAVEAGYLLVPNMPIDVLAVRVDRAKQPEKVSEAAARAMALRIFDQIGQVQNSGGRDPILVGQLLDPRGNGRRTTFFIAWWVDTESL